MNTLLIRERLREFPACDVRGSACIGGANSEYRYLLSRRWDDQHSPVVWIMLNPSTADADVDDATIRKCMRFAWLWGAGGILVVNLYAWRVTKPAELVAARRRGYDPIGPQNNAYIAQVISGATSVVCAWGANAEPARVQEVVRILRGATELGHAPAPQALRFTGGGQPWHPLYIPYDTLLLDY